MNIFDEFYSSTTAKKSQLNFSNDYGYNFNYKTDKSYDWYNNDPILKHSIPLPLPSKNKNVQNTNDIISYICQENNFYDYDKRLSGLSIIIAAYNTENYIELTLDSIQSLNWCMEHDNYEILIGVDGCNKTLLKVKEIMSKYKNIYVYNMSSNEGTFVTANTLISISKYDKILRFDSDDFFINENSLDKIMQYSNYDVVRYKYIDYHNKDSMTHNNQYAYGSILFNASILKKVGGYINWKCSGDYEFYTRIKNNVSVYELDTEIYYHRIRKDSLMSDKSTSMNSDYRQHVNAIVQSYDFKKGDDIYKKPVINTYRNIMPDGSIIVSLTSWPKRIQSVHTVMQSILNNTEKPYKIIINLSINEFPDKLNSIPEELKNMAAKNVIMINWLTNNSFVWKKSLPAIVKYPESYIICIDDDFIYPQDFISTFKNMHNKYPDIPLTGTNSKLHNVLQHCGCSSMDNLHWLEPYIYYINDMIYKLGDEDTFLTVCYEQNNIVMKYTEKRFHFNMKSLNLKNGYSLSHNLTPGVNFDTIKKEMLPDLIEFVTVNYNTPELLENLLFSFNRYSNGKFHFRVIDGSDTDSYRLHVLEVTKKYKADINLVKYNIHHGPGMDYAINTSKYKYVFIVDSDLEFTSDILPIAYKMVNMNKAITGFTDQVDSNGINVKDKCISYIHPRYMLVNVKAYKLLSAKHNVKFIKHGAPCINVMKYIHDNKLENKMLGMMNAADSPKYFKESKCGTSGKFGMNL